MRTCLQKMELLLLASIHIPQLRIMAACLNQNGTNIVRAATRLQIIPPRNPIDSILWGPGQYGSTRLMKRIDHVLPFT